MKTNRILSIFFMFAALVSSFVSCSKESLPEDSVYASVSSYTFAAEGESFSLAVKSYNRSGEDWEYRGGADWLVFEKNGDILVMTASANDTESLREAVLTLVSGEASTEIALSQLYGRFQGSFVTLSSGEYGYQTKFSINGHYCAGYVGEYLSDGMTQTVTPIIINLETGEETRYKPSTEYNGIRAVCDNGRMLSLTQGSVGCILLVDGAETEIPIPAGYETPVVTGFSADGNIMVGYAKEADSYCYRPVKWTGMEPEILEIPETDMLGEEYFQGAMARGCSSDGSIIYGSEWDTQGFVYWDSEGMHFAAKETSVTRPIDYMGMTIEMPAYFKKTAEGYSISQNGRYVAGTFTDYLPGENGNYQVATADYPAVYDTQADELTVFDDLAGYSAFFVDNNGNVFGGMAGMGYVLSESGALPVDEWMQSNYGVTMSGDRYIMNLSDDGMRMGGWRAEINASSQTVFTGWYYAVK